MAKCNLAAETDGLGYSVEEGDAGAPVVAWEKEPVSIHADEAVTQEQELTSALEIAEDWLRETLAAGPVAALEIVSRAQAFGVKETTLNRAARKLGVKHQKTVSGWFWIQDCQECQDSTSGNVGDVGKVENGRVGI